MGDLDPVAIARGVYGGCGRSLTIWEILHHEYTNVFFYIGGSRQTIWEGDIGHTIGCLADPFLIDNGDGHHLGSLSVSCLIEKYSFSFITSTEESSAGALGAYRSLFIASFLPSSAGRTTLGTAWDANHSHCQTLTNRLFYAAMTGIWVVNFKRDLERDCS